MLLGLSLYLVNLSYTGGNDLSLELSDVLLEMAAATLLLLRTWHWLDLFLFQAT